MYNKWVVIKEIKIVKNQFEWLVNYRSVDLGFF